MGIFRVFLLFSLASPLWGQEVTYLRNYGELVIALEQGHHVTAIFNSRLCTGDSEDGDPVMVVPLDPWSRQATTDGTMDFVTFNHQLIDGDGNFVLIAGSAEAATGNATAILVNINTMNASIVQKTTYNCKINEGAYFVQKRYFHPSESLTSYLQLRGALLNGEHVTSVGYGERCSNPFPGYRIAQGGSFHLQFYVNLDDAGEEYILLEYSSLALFPEDSLNFLSIQMKVRQNGRVEIVNSAYDIQTWENEYPFADPLQCDIDVSVGFYRVPGEQYNQYATFIEIEEALLSGQELQAAVLRGGCSETVLKGKAPREEWSGTGVRLLDWVQFADELGHSIFFAQTLAASVDGANLQEYWLRDTGALEMTVTNFNPATGDVTSQVVYTCPLTSGLLMSSPARQSSLLSSYYSVYAAMLTGLHLEARVDFRLCEDPTGSGQDFSGVTSGAYLRELFFANPETPESVIVSASFTMVSDLTDGDGFAYQSMLIVFDPTDLVIVLPAYWTTVDGVWTNILGAEFYLECNLGEGVVVYSSIQD